MDEFVTNILKLYGESTEDTLPKCEMDIKCEHFSQITYSDHAVNIASKIPQTDTKFDKSAVPIFTKAFTESIEDLNAPISDEEDSVKTKTDAIILLEKIMKLLQLISHKKMGVMPRHLSRLILPLNGLDLSITMEKLLHMLKHSPFGLKVLLIISLVVALIALILS